MKKLASILLLTSFLFNWFGYSFVSTYLQYRSDNTLEAMLDHKAYNDQQLLAIKIPLHLPYLSVSGNFERVDGEIVLQGVHYKYVKRRIYNDSLVLLCLPNKAKENLLKAEDAFYRVVNGIDHPADGKATQKNYSFFKNCLNDYYPAENNWSLQYCAPVTNQYLQAGCHIGTLYPADTPGQPPENSFLFS